MGAGNSAGNVMAIQAMSKITPLGKKELLELRRKLNEIAQRQGNKEGTLSASSLREALEAAGIGDADTEMLLRLHTLADKTGDERVAAAAFLSGLAPLCGGSEEEKLTFALELYDTGGTGRVSAQDLTAVLTAINDTAAYFGDPCVTADEIAEVVAEAMARADGGSGGSSSGGGGSGGSGGGALLPYAQHVGDIADHPVVVKFAAGQGTERFTM